ncbi:unnamed protein product, partial [marine sediment metagenome]
FYVERKLKIKERQVNQELADEEFAAEGKLPADLGASVYARPRIVEELEGEGKTKLIDAADDSGADEDLLAVFQDRLPDGKLPAEGYLLQTGPDGALVVVGDELGGIRARQTLRRLERQGAGAVRIADWPGQAWRGFFVIPYTPKAIPALEGLVRDFLVPLKCNLLVLQLDYHFKYKSHPEVREGKQVFSKKQLRRLARLCREEGITLAPLLNCLGHQSWKQEIHGLLRAHPEFEEVPDAKTPESDPESKKFYCRSWCPLHPE